MPTAHALLSASGAHCWLECVASPAMCAGLPDETSLFAAEGTAAHTLSEWCFEHDVDADFYLGEDIDGFKVTHEMADNVQIYVDYVRAQEGDLFVETRVDFSKYVPEGFGTADASVIPYLERTSTTLKISDLKYGKGIKVFAEWNPQQLLYGLGVLNEFDFLLENIEDVQVAIVQPRLDHIDEFTISVNDLKEWGEYVVKPKAQLAWDLLQGTKKVKPEHFNPGHKTCQWCKIKGSCEERAKWELGMLADEFDGVIDENIEITKPGLMSPEQIAKLLPRIPEFIKWAEAVQSSALSMMERGEEVPGYKLVHKSAHRKWTDEAQVVKALKNRKVRNADIYKTTLQTPAQIEKLLGKGNKVVEDLSYSPQGGITYAPESDDRPAVNVSPDALFGDV